MPRIAHSARRVGLLPEGGAARARDALTVAAVDKEHLADPFKPEKASITVSGARKSQVNSAIAASLPAAFPEKAIDLLLRILQWRSLHC